MGSRNKSIRNDANVEDETRVFNHGDGKMMAREECQWTFLPHFACFGSCWVRESRRKY